MTAAQRRAARWDRALALKLTAGVVLALLAPAVGAVINVATRQWPTGGPR